MKKAIPIYLLILIGSFLTWMTSCDTPHSAEHFAISGTINGIDSGVVVLKRPNLTDRSLTTIDSVAFIGGRFKINGKLDGPERVTLIFLPGNWSLSFFAQNGEIQVDADTSAARHYDWTSYGGEKGAELMDFTVTGSPSEDEFTAYQNHPVNRKFHTAFADINKRLETASEEEKITIREEARLVRDEATAWEKHWLDSFIAATPESVVGAYLFYEYFQFNEDIDLEDMGQTLGKLQGEAKASPYYAQLDKSYQQRLALAPGESAPDFTALRPDSTEFKLSSTRGKLVLIDFWASWCVPCRESIPHWKALYEQYSPKGFEIVGITNDSRWSDWFLALEEENMPWIQVADDFPIKRMPARIATEYMIPYLPTYVLLDPEGTIIFHNGSKEEITEEVKRRLDNPV